MSVQTLESLSVGLISEYKIRGGQLLVSYIDAHGDMHTHQLLHPELTQDEALNLVVQKQDELDSNRVDPDEIQDELDAEEYLKLQELAH